MAGGDVAGQSGDAAVHAGGVGRDFRGGGDVSVSERTAHKSHECHVCGKKIKPAARYISWAVMGLTHDRICVHLPCWKIIQQWSREDIEDMLGVVVNGEWPKLDEHAISGD